MQMHKIKLDDLTPNTEAQLDVQESTDDNTDSTETVETTNKQNLEATSMKKASRKITLIVTLVALVAGVATGYGGYKLKAKTGTSQKVGQKKTDLQRVATENQIQAGDTFGVEDAKTFSDQAQGYLEKGGINGEGSHKLLRLGGVSQTVYLTSSITDLDKFAGMEVKIWGETFKGQKAGWLMDVGRVEVIDTEAQIPTE